MLKKFILIIFIVCLNVVAGDENDKMHYEYILGKLKGYFPTLIERIGVNHRKFDGSNSIPLDQLLTQEQLTIFDINLISILANKFFNEYKKEFHLITGLKVTQNSPEFPLITKISLPTKQELRITFYLESTLFNSASYILNLESKEIKNVDLSNDDMTNIKLKKDELLKTFPTLSQASGQLTQNG